MSPALASWIRDHGRRLVAFPSQIYKTVQLWYVPASPYDPVADLVDISGGAYVNTVGSHCGGYTVTDGSLGSFYSAYQALGGKSVVGDPVSQVTGSGSGSHEQLFDGVVLADQPSAGPPSAVRRRPVPSYHRLGRSSAADRGHAGERLPCRLSTGGPPPDPQPRHGRRTTRLVDQPGHHARLPERRRGQRRRLRRRRPALRGTARAAFRASRRRSRPGLRRHRARGARRGGSAHAATVTPAALAARVLTVPPRARAPQPPPPLPDPFPPGPPSRHRWNRSSVLGAALRLYGRGPRCPRHTGPAGLGGRAAAGAPPWPPRWVRVARR